MIFGSSLLTKPIGHFEHKKLSRTDITVVDVDDPIPVEIGVSELEGCIVSHHPHQLGLPESKLPSHIQESAVDVVYLH